jgi:teichoic acid transport system permease protein
LDLAKYAAENGLKRVGARPPFLAYIKESWRRRDFAWTLSSYTNQAQNARNRLGRWWMVLTPAMQGAMYGLIFGIILGSDNRPENFISYLFCGVFLFSFLQGTFTNGATSVTGNAGLVKSLSFPRVLLPISATIQQFINLVPQLGLLLFTILIFGNVPTFEWLLFIPAIALMVLFGAGSSMLAARMTVQFSDLNKVIPFAFRLIFYSSGIFYSIDKILQPYPIALEIMKYNPYSSFIQLVRGILINGYDQSAHLWLICAGWAVLLPLVSVLLFWKVEERHGRED